MRQVSLMLSENWLYQYHNRFDMRHHRVLTYYPNTEGLNDLAKKLKEKLKQVSL